MTAIDEEPARRGSPEWRAKYPLFSRRQLDGEDVNPISAEEMTQARAELRGLEADVQWWLKKQSAMKSEQTALEDNLRWLLGSARLERNDCSRFHKLREAAIGSKILVDRAAIREDIRPHHIFLVEHDWAAAFDGSGDYDNGAVFRLPYEHCAFELRVSGHTCIYLATQHDTEIALQCFTNFGEFWVSALPKQSFELDGCSVLDLGMRQLRAICVALESEVAIHSVVRAPSALNFQREKKGKPRLCDYNIVSLNRRVRAESANMGGTHNSPRLHFRRGHWRHLPTHRVWVHWTLVGDPDLGFVDKHYKL